MSWLIVSTLTYLLILITNYSNTIIIMKKLCCVALRTVLFCACFSPVLLACEDSETVGAIEKVPLTFNERYFEKLSEPLSDNLIYSKAVSLKRNSVIQCMDIAKNGDIYYVQIAGSDQHQLNVLHGAPNEQNPSDCMVFEYFGHGTNMAIEEAADGTYIWLGSHGSKGSDGSYGGSQTISRVKYEPGKSVQLAGGDVFCLKDTRNIHPAINVEKDLLGVQYSKKVSGIDTRVFVIYRLSEAMKLVPVDMKLESLKYGGEDIPETTVTPSIKARELSQLQPLYQFAVSDGQGGMVGELAFQGYDINEQFVYYYEGMGYLDGTPSKAYVSVLGNNGLLSARKEVVAAADAVKLKELGVSAKGYLEAEGIKVKNGVLYLGFASRGSADERLANILRYANE